MEFDDPALFECLVNYPPYYLNIPYPIDYITLSQQQQQDNELRQVFQHNANYDFTEIAPNIHVITFNGKIVIPNDELNNLVRWYHLHLQHIGLTRLLKTISLHFYHPQLRRTIDNIVRTCDLSHNQVMVICQLNRLQCNLGTILRLI